MATYWRRGAKDLHLVSIVHILHRIALQGYPNNISLAAQLHGYPGLLRTTQKFPQTSTRRPKTWVDDGRQVLLFIA